MEPERYRQMIEGFNAQSRTRALASIKKEGRKWAARIGGDMRGHFETYKSKKAATQAVHAHYDAALQRQLHREKVW